MIVYKYDFKTHEYTEQEISANLKITCYENDINTIVNCAECNEKIRYVDTYSSNKIHTKGGIGYCVCGKCYDKEWQEEKKVNQS
jgi:hypothetical protein